MPGTFSPAFFLSRRTVRELSVFVDESGSDGLSDRHYLLTVVMHDQPDGIADSIEAYEGALRAKGLGVTGKRVDTHAEVERAVPLQDAPHDIADYIGSPQDPLQTTHSRRRF